jgi:nucleoside-diphosphate-sugar epimerase
MYSTPYILTGGNGWLGRRVSLALTEGNPELGALGSGGKNVSCLLATNETGIELQSLGVKITRGDINDPIALNQLMQNGAGGTLIHMAGVIHPRWKTKVFDTVNVKGVFAVLEMAKRYGIKRMIVVSSNSPFGENPSRGNLFNESSPYSPYMGYGKSKMKMEMILIDHMKSGLIPEITILRAPWFYGPGQPPRQTLFFKMIKEGRFPIFGDGLNRRSMGYIDSLTLGILLAANKKEAANQIFWIADKNPYSMIEVIKIVKGIMQEDFRIKVSPKQLRLPSVIPDIARVVDGAIQSLGFYNQKIHVLSEMNMTIACDIHKAEKVLGYEPLVDLKEGMKRSIDWCLSNGQKF